MLVFVATEEYSIGIILGHIINGIKTVDQTVIIDSPGSRDNYAGFIPLDFSIVHHCANIGLEELHKGKLGVCPVVEVHRCWVLGLTAETGFSKSLHAVPVLLPNQL